MTENTRFVSHAQNGEDVVLWRALGHIESGVYIDVGANDPTSDSISRSFYDRGWAGVAIEPSPDFASRYREQRPRDQVIEAVVTDGPEMEVTLHMISGTGLSTIVESVRAGHANSGYTVTDVVVPARRLDEVIDATGLADRDIHFMSIDTEGAEPSVLGSIDLTRFRPWVLVVEATAPNSTTRTHEAWEPALLASGYVFCMFDGLSRFYVAEERRSELADKLDYPTCVFDDFTTPAEVAAASETARLHRAVRDEAERADRAVAELNRTQNTLSWRVTRPLRWAYRTLHKGAGA